MDYDWLGPSVTYIVGAIMKKNEEKGHPGNVGAHYQYLFMKELMVELRQHSD